MGFEELCRSLYAKREMEEKWGVRTKTAQIADNPGVSCALVGLLADAGVRYLTHWPNAYAMGLDGRTLFADATSPDRPCVFWWEAPDGRSRVLVWTNERAYIGGGEFGLSILCLQESHQLTIVTLLAISENYHLVQIEEFGNHVDCVLYLIEVDDTRLVVDMREDNCLATVGYGKHTEGICRGFPFRTYDIRPDDRSECLHVDYREPSLCERIDCAQHHKHYHKPHCCAP